MRFEATVDGRTVRVEVRGANGRYTVSLDGSPLEVDVQDTGSHFVSLLVDGRSHTAGLERRGGGYTVHLREDTVHVELAEAVAGAAPTRPPPASGPAQVLAPMPGKLVRVLVVEGEQVVAGQGLVVMEAMKMENELRAPRAGRVAQLHARERQAVDTGAILVVLE